MKERKQIPAHFNGYRLDKGGEQVPMHNYDKSIFNSKANNTSDIS